MKRNVFKAFNYYLKFKGDSKLEEKGINFFKKNYPFIKTPKVISSNKFLITKKINFMPFKEIIEKDHKLDKLKKEFWKYIEKSREFESNNSKEPFIVSKDLKNKFGNILDLFVEDIYSKLKTLNIKGYPLQGDLGETNFGGTEENKMAIIDFEHFSQKNQIPFEILGFYSPLFIKKIKLKKEIYLEDKLLKESEKFMTNKENILFKAYLIRDIGIFSYYLDPTYSEDFQKKFCELKKYINI